MSNSVVDGVYRFDGYFNQVPKYSMTVKFGSEGPDGGVSTKKFTIFKCKLAKRITNYLQGAAIIDSSCPQCEVQIFPNT